MIKGENGKISKELFDITRQTLDCYTSDIRWDILVQLWRKPKEEYQTTYLGEWTFIITDAQE
jgi:hypothetical protein